MAFVNEIRARADYFNVIIEGGSRKSIKFLDMMITVDGRRFVFMPACKETNLSRPLDVTSRHAPHVH